MNAADARERGTPEKNKQAKKVAFVLSGGGNRGALEVGALLVLLEHEIQPQILVGTSVGAINAAFLATNPTLEGARSLERVWLEVSDKVFSQKDYISAVWRLVTRKSSLYDSNKLRDLLESYFPEGIRQFSDIKAVELYITAVDLQTGELRVFGKDRSESILDAVMASSALPIVFAPWKYEGRQYVDGGVVSDLPLRVAVEAGATELYAIDIGPLQLARRTPKGVLRVAGQTIDAVISHQLANELGWSKGLPGEAIHYIEVGGFEKVRFWDFSRTAKMIEKGRLACLEHLRRRGLL